MPELVLVSSYPPEVEALGGGGWVDRRVLAQLSAQFVGEVSCFPVATLMSGAEHIALEVRHDKMSMARTVQRMIRHNEPYGVAKFAHSPAWMSRARELRHTARDARIVASQLPSLLLCLAAGKVPDVYVAHNAEHVLAQQHNPRILEKAWQDSCRLMKAEQSAMSDVPVIAALSRRDVETFGSWRGNVRHLPLLGPRKTRSEVPRTIGFIGKLGWPPNAAALNVLVRDVLPRVRDKLGSETPQLLVAGRGSERQSPVDGVEFLGEVSDLEDFYRRVGVCVVPRLGVSTGISVKVLEALEHGVSVVAPRALADAAGVTGVVVPGDDPEEVAAAICNLLSGGAVARQVDDSAEPFDWDAALKGRAQ